MEFDLYDAVVRQLTELQYSGKVAFHVNNEPLLFPDLERFVEHARRALPNAWIQILTNGLMLRPERAERLLEAGIDELSINYYAKKRIPALAAVFEEIRETVIPRYFGREAVLRGHGQAAHGELFRFNVFERNEDAVITTRGGTSPNKLSGPVGLRGFCEHPFTQFNINPGGIVSKCCADVQFADPMGSVVDTSILEIWHGPRFQSVRRRLLEGNRREIMHCRDCDYYGARKVYSKEARDLYQLTQ